MKRRTVHLIVALVLFLGMLSPGPTHAAGELTSRLYLVGLKSGVSPAALTRAGVSVQQVWPGFGTVGVMADSTTVARLRLNPAVASIEPNRQFFATTRTTLIPNSTEVPWALRSITAPAAWKEGSTGTGIKVCDLDSGIDFSHPKFKGVVKGSKNFVADGHANAADGNGHGTYTAGEIAASANGTDVVGAAYGVQLYIARVLDDNGEGTTSSLLNAVTWCVKTVHARILNMSFGSDQPSQAEQRLFTTIYKEGVLSFAATGNDGQHGVSYPAAYSSVIAVGAVDSSEAVASFSNYGSKVELVAPGVHVLSTVPVGTGLKVSAVENGTAYTANSLQYAPAGTVMGPLVECGLADTPASCAGIPSAGTWIALVERGTVTFSEKLRNVMAQGAAAVMIVNNDASNPDDAGSFTLASDGTWIPALSVSYRDGAALRAGHLGAATISLTPWDFAYADGTSASSPYAAAVAALAWSANPALTNVEIRSVLDKTAKDLGPTGRDPEYGYGLLQAKEAVALARSTKV